MSQAFGHAGMTQWLVHQHQGKHLQQAVLDVLLQLGDLAAQVIQHRCQGRARRMGHNRQVNVASNAAFISDANSKLNCQPGEGNRSYLRPTASMGSSSSLMSGWMLGPMALESMLIQVNTVASTCMVFCLLHKFKRKRGKRWAAGESLVFSFQSSSEYKYPNLK